MTTFKKICAAAVAIAMVLEGAWAGSPAAVKAEEASQGKALIAEFTLDGTEGGYKSAGAVATLHSKEEGETVEFACEEVDGKSGLRFDSSKWLEVTKTDGSSLLKGLSGFTVSYDSYTESSSANNYVFFLTNTHEDGQATAANAGIYPRFGIIDYSGIMRVLNGTDGFNGEAETGWKHVDVVYSGENVTTYVDGVQVSTKAAYEGIARILAADESYVWIGKGPFNPLNSQLFDGYLSDFKIYNYALTEEELRIPSVIEVSGVDGVEQVRQGSALQMRAIVRDQYGDEKTGQDLTWSVSADGDVSISEEGLLTVGENAAAGTVKVTAVLTADSGIKGTKEITISAKEAVPSKITSITVAGEGGAAKAAQGTTLQMSAIVKDQFGDVMADEEVTWSAEGSGGRIDMSGLLTIDMDAGIGNIITVTAASSADTDVKGTKEITVIAGDRVKKVIAEFALDGTEGGYKSDGAVATLHSKEEGEAAEFACEEVDGKSGLRFDSSKWLEVTKTDGSSLLKGLSGFTVSYDSYTESSSANNYAFFLTNTHEDGQATAANAGTYPRFGIIDYSGTMRVLNGTDGFNGEAETGWKHVDVVYSGENVTAYVDGVQVSTKAAYEGIARILAADASYIWIGKGPFSPAEFFDGYLSNFKIYNYALTEDELVSGPEEKMVTSIEVSSVNAVDNAEQGTSVQMNAVVMDQNGDVMSGEDVTWSVNGESKASVSRNGLLSVGSDAIVGSVITVTAASVAKPEVKGTKEITVIAGKGGPDGGKPDAGNPNDGQPDGGNADTGHTNTGSNNNESNANVNGSAGGVSTSSSKSLKKAKITVKKGKKKVSKVTVNNGKTIRLSVSTSSKAKLSLGKMTKKQKKIAKVTIKNKKITIKGKRKGKVSIKIVSAKTKNYKKAEKTVKITVK